MKQTIRNVLMLAGLSLALPVTAATITVTNGPNGNDLFGPSPTYDDVSPNTSLDALPVTPVSGDDAGADNGTPGVCTLREAILTAEGQRAPTPQDCARYNLFTGFQTSKPFAYCPWYPNSGGTLVTDGECDPEAKATDVSVDEIVFDPRSRGTHRLDFTLPLIKNPVSFKGLGPDQTIITGDADELAAANPPPAIGAASPRFADLAIFQIHPDLPSGAEVKFQDLTIRGTRVHYFRAPNGVPEVVFTVPGPAPETSNCRNPSSAGSGQPCCGPKAAGSPNADATYPACNTTDVVGAPPGMLTQRSIINFAGIVMDHGVAAERKKLTLSNTRMVCNRRGSASNVPGAPGHTPGTALMAFTNDGGAISVLGRAIVNLQTASFSNNVSELGSGGAVFAGAKDNGSPEVNINGSLFDADTNQICQDTVVATFTGDDNPTDAQTTQNEGNAGRVCTGTINAASPCPTATPVSQAYSTYAPGNFAGAALAPAVALGGLPATVATSGPVPRVAAADAAATTGDGGAVALNAQDAVTGNIGPLVIANTKFFGNSARRDGGALSVANVARSDSTAAAFTLTDVLFSSPNNDSNGALPGIAGNASAANNRAGRDGGAISILGSASQSAKALLTRVSLSYNRANRDGGALNYRSQANAAIDFSLNTVRFSLNSAGQDGAGIMAQDNGADDSGTLNIAKATFDNNAATRDGGAVYCGATKLGSQFTNMSLSGNQAGNTGGGLFVGRRCHAGVNNATITDNSAGLVGEGGSGLNGGGGIFVPATAASGRVDVRNSVLARNKSRDQATDPAGGDTTSVNGADCSAANNNVLRTAGFNFVGNRAGCATVFAAGIGTVSGSSNACLNNSTGDIVGDTAVAPCAAVPLDPRLGILRDNGGPDIAGARSFTHHPETNSPLINNGASSGCRDGSGAVVADDQRGFSRGGSSGRCDIGAIEVGGGQTPTLGTVSVSAATSNLLSRVRLSSFETEVEMLRLAVTAPTAQAISVKGIAIRSENVTEGIPAFFDNTNGRYGSVRGFEVTVVDGDGRDLDVPLFRITGNPDTLPQFDSSTRLLSIPFTSPIPLAAGQTAFVSVRFIFEPRLTALAMAEPVVMIATASGLGMVAFLGLLGAGASRRRALFVAAVLLGLSSLTGCSGGDGDGFDGEDGSRSFRISVRQVTFDTQAAQGNQQAVAADGTTITVLPP